MAHDREGIAVVAGTHLHGIKMKTFLGGGKIQAPGKFLKHHYPPTPSLSPQWIYWLLETKIQLNISLTTNPYKINFEGVRTSKTSNANGGM